MVEPGVRDVRVAEAWSDVAIPDLPDVSQPSAAELKSSATSSGTHARAPSTVERAIEIVASAFGTLRGGCGFRCSSWW